MFLLITLTIIKIWEILFQRIIFSFLYEVQFCYTRYLNLRFICLVTPDDSLVWITILYIMIENINGIFWNILFLVKFFLDVHKGQFLLPFWYCSFFRKKRGVLNNFHELPSPFLKNYEHENLLVVVHGMYHITIQVDISKTIFLDANILSIKYNILLLKILLQNLPYCKRCE